MEQQSATSSSDRATKRYCCNPFNLPHTKKIVKGLHKITTDAAAKLKKVTGQDLEGVLCPTCRRELSSRFQSQTSGEAIDNSSGEEPEAVKRALATEAVDTTAGAFGVSPLKFRKISKRDSPGYGGRKIQQLQQKLTESIAVAGGLDIGDMQPEAEASQAACQNCEDYTNLLSALQSKCIASTSRNDKLQILTLQPKSWSRKRVAEEFQVSERMVKAARKLRDAECVLARPAPKKGKPLADMTKRHVAELYEDDEFSRLCPGMKDKVSVRINGIKTQMQKRLLLCNLNELFTYFRNKYPAKIGFSKFCELRPQWCITVGASGTHSVCVCMHHQNIKLMLAGTQSITEDYKELIGKTVCDLNSRDCMLRRCDNCPGEEPLHEYLVQIFEDSDPEATIEFKQWIQTDRANLISNQLSVEEFVKDVSAKLTNLSVHHYIAKHQANYLKRLKENLQEDKLVILMDFAENYSFMMQDEIQGFHWDNSQATLHPFAVYTRENDGVKCHSMCIISDCLQHNAVTVYVFIRTVLQYLKANMATIRHIYYFSDGSAAQYKNFKNFANLCHHEKDYGISAEWNFFATSHGKSPCDGIGGTIKRLAQRASLQSPLEGHILTAEDLYKFCEKQVPGVKSFFVSSAEVEEVKEVQEQRYAKAHTVAGTREHHCFKPIDVSQMSVSRVSADCTSFMATLSVSDKVFVKAANLQPGQYVACIYDTKWWIGNVCKVSLEEEDALINFMHPHGPCRNFHWPSTLDKCWIPEIHILCIVPVPTASTLGRNYSLPVTVIQDVQAKFAAM